MYRRIANKNAITLNRIMDKVWNFYERRARAIYENISSVCYSEHVVFFRVVKVGILNTASLQWHLNSKQIYSTIILHIQYNGVSRRYVLAK